MDATKIRLSAKEAELISNADWILTKNEILKKVKHLLEELMKGQQKHISSFYQLPAEILAPPPKISKGENYRGLPYLVLDHPRYFDKDNTFALRTLFWWGNFFSVTLHLGGGYKKKYEQAIASSYQLMKEQDVYCCVNDEQWEHHFEKDNYTAVNELSDADLRKIIAEKKFIKLAKKISLPDRDNASHKRLNDFRLFIEMLQAHQLHKR